MAVNLTNLSDLIVAVAAHEGAWGSTCIIWNANTNRYRLLRNDSALACEVNSFLWATYDPNSDFIYPNIKRWDYLLEHTIKYDNYCQLNTDEILSILFGLHHRTRVSDGLWTSMFEHGVMQKLLARLRVLETT